MAGTTVSISHEVLSRPPSAVPSTTSPHDGTNSMSLRKRTSRLMANVPAARKAPSSQLSIPQHQDPSQYRSLFDMIESRDTVQGRSVPEQLDLKPERQSSRAHDNCERRIRELSQQLADALELVKTLRDSSKPECEGGETSLESTDPPQLTFSSPSALSTSDTHKQADLDAEEVLDYERGFCYVDSYHGRQLNGIEEESSVTFGTRGVSRPYSTAPYTSRPGFKPRMTTERRNRLSAVIGDNMLCLSEIPDMDDGIDLASSASSSNRTSPNSSLSSANITDGGIEPLASLMETADGVSQVRVPMAVSHSTRARKTREVPSELAMSCEVGSRINRTFENPLGGRQGYINRKFKPVIGRPSVTAYRA